MSIGENIRTRRLQLDMTLEEVASIVKVSRQTMSRYENGIIGNIPTDKIELIAKALRTTPAYIMGWEQQDKKTAAPKDSGEMQAWISAWDQAGPEARQAALAVLRLGAQQTEPPEKPKP